MVEELAVVAVVAVIAYSKKIATTYSKTTHGSNPWTVDALLNAVRHAVWFEKCMQAIDGSLNDAYRCPQVNAAVGGVATSYHQRGLAIDIHPGPGFTPQTAAAKLYSMAKAGQLGPVRTVIWEPTWAHVDYHDPAEVGPPLQPNYFKKVGTKYERIPV